MKTKLILISTILLISCGSRKVNKSETTEQSKVSIIDTSKITTNIDTNTKVIDCTNTDEVTIEPVDNSQPILVNGKTYKNVRFKTKKVKNNITTDKVEKVAKNKQKAVIMTKESKKSVEVKQVERKQFNWLSLWWLLLLIIAMVYLGYKYRKELFL